MPFRIALIGSDEKLAQMIRDLGTRLEANGRRLDDIDILAFSTHAQYTAGAPDAYLDVLGELAGMGVTWTAAHLARGSFHDALDGLRRFGDEVIASAR